MEALMTLCLFKTVEIERLGRAWACRQDFYDNSLPRQERPRNWKYLNGILRLDFKGPGNYIKYKALLFILCISQIVLLTLTWRRHPGWRYHLIGIRDLLPCFNHINLIVAIINCHYIPKPYVLWTEMVFESRPRIIPVVNEAIGSGIDSFLPGDKPEEFGSGVAESFG
jgi:hypothetical protein